MALSHAGVSVPEAEVRRILKTHPYAGAHPINLLRLSEFGYTGWPFEGTEQDLRQRVAEGQPVIVFLWTAALRHWAERGGIDYQHSVVAAGWDDSSVLVHDPMLQYGPIELSWSEFRDAWRYTRQMAAVIEPSG
jgi:predicted double-glycine peptidase